MAKLPMLRADQMYKFNIWIKRADADTHLNDNDAKNRVDHTHARTHHRRQYIKVCGRGEPWSKF